MLTGQVPFKDSPAEVMYQHQRAPLPFEQAKDVPQALVVLLEVLLEKDPARRLQSPAELLNALPKVADAVKTRHTITHQSLREVAIQRLGSSGKAIQILTNLVDIIAVRRVRLFLLPALGLALAAGAILAVNIFFRPRSSAPQEFRSSSPAVTAPEKSIAVLPFESLSENKSDTYFADGVQDEILSDLAKVSQLRVISRTSVMTFRSDSHRDLRSIATALDVGRVLEGTVRRAGNRVRITTELIDAKTDRTLWSESYDRDLTDIFAIQSEIAQKVASRLSAQLSPEERENIEEKPTSNLEAYDLYFQAKELLINANLSYLKDPRETLLNAIGFLEEATRKDPKCAPAYCLLAKAHDYLYDGDFEKTPERRALGDAAVSEALRLRPDLPEVHLAAAFHRYACYRDYDGARVQIAIAQRSLPNSPDALALVADLDRRQGRWEESTAVLKKAVTLDPRNPEFLSELADNYFALRRYPDYEQTYDRLIGLEPDKPILVLQRAFSALNGNADLTSYRTALEGLPSSLKDDIIVVSSRFAYALAKRDWGTANEILGSKRLRWN